MIGSINKQLTHARTHSLDEARVGVAEAAGGDAGHKVQVLLPRRVPQSAALAPVIIVAIRCWNGGMCRCVGVYVGRYAYRI